MNVNEEVRAVLVKGSVTAMAVALATIVCDTRENGHFFRALNAVSHMIWGAEAKHQDSFSARYTLPALALNFAAISGWALCHRAGMLAIQSVDKSTTISRRKYKKRALSLGFAVSALAYVIDFYAVPPRLRPGIETQISRRSLVFLYVVLALSLAMSGRSDAV